MKEIGSMVTFFISNENMDLIKRFMAEYKDAGVETIDDAISAMFVLISDYIKELNKRSENE
jgi:hypothetical protein